MRALSVCVQVSARAKKRGLPQMGTLGAGNHYAEVQVVDEIFDEAAARKMGIDTVGQVRVNAARHACATFDQVHFNMGLMQDDVLAFPTAGKQGAQHTCGSVSIRFLTERPRGSCAQEASQPLPDFMRPKSISNKQPRKVLTKCAHACVCAQVCVMIHSGSRGLGHQVATDALVEMEAAMGRDGIKTNDRQLACARINSKEGQVSHMFFSCLTWCQSDCAT